MLAAIVFQVSALLARCRKTGIEDRPISARERRFGKHRLNVNQASGEAIEDRQAEPPRVVRDGEPPAAGNGGVH